MSFILACDLGSTSLRAALVDRAGTIYFMARQAGPVVHEVDGGIETDIEAWWSSFASTVEQLAVGAGASFDDIQAIAISGVTRTQVFVDEAGNVLRPAMTWADARSLHLLEEMAGLLPTDHPERHNINPFHPVARAFWLARSEPDVFCRLATILEPKDYFAARLTGRRTTDPISSARLIAAAAPGPDGRSILDCLGIGGVPIPEVVVPGDIIGNAASGLPGNLRRLTGRPVVAMGHDTWTSVLGLGALRAGYAYNLSGTTEVLGLISDKPAEAEGLMNVAWGTSLHQLGGPSQNGADTVVWALDTFGNKGATVGDRLDTLLSGERTQHPLLFLPYLLGERTPYWDPDLRGAFVGLNRQHTRADLIRSVLEGISLVNRIVLDRAETATGRMAHEIRFGGGGASNQTWCQIKADVCERPVVVTTCPEPGLLGAAIVGWAALGELTSLAEGQDRLVSIARRYEPNPGKSGHYRHLFALFRHAEGALRPISRSLADWHVNGSVETP